MKNIEFNDNSPDEVCKRQELVKIAYDLGKKSNEFINQQGKGKRPSKEILEKEEKIISLKESGISNREIARMTSVSEGTVRNILKKK